MDHAPPSPSRSPSPSLSPSLSRWATESEFQAALRRRHLINAAVALVGAILFLLALVLPATGSQSAQSPQTRSTSGPAPTTEPADEIMDRLLRDQQPTTPPTTTTSTKPSTFPATGGTLDPARFAGALDRSTGAGDQVVAPDTPPVRLAREGSYVIDRTGRILPSRDGGGLEFVFDADGATAASAVEPAMMLLPNLNLMAVERTLEASPDRRFRVTGRVTEYRGRNYLMLEKVIFLN